MHGNHTQREARRYLEQAFHEALDRVVPADGGAPLTSDTFLQFLNHLRQLPADLPMEATASCVSGDRGMERSGAD